MNKKVLIISPHFPPVNAADMQRVRMSLPYFAQNGWDAEVVIADPAYSDQQKDELLLESVPATIKIHKVKAIDKKWTSKLGFGNIAFRAYKSYKQTVNALLTARKFDLIYFSTTQFPLCTLGAYWKRKFGVQFVIDMQDPWHSEYYRDKPKHQRPPKHWLSYRMHKKLEPIAMKQVDGLISVSESYIADLKNRYPQIKSIPAATITFGSFKPDMDIARKHQNDFAKLLDANYTNVVYLGRGGIDMHEAIKPLFSAFKHALNNNPEIYEQLKFYFIGTSYAANGTGTPTILPLAGQYGITKHVTEVTDRISYYHTLSTLLQADALFIPGSDDPKYTASKIYPYLLTEKPMLAIFNEHSPALPVLKSCGAPYAYNYNNIKESELISFFDHLLAGSLPAPTYNETCLEQYSAQNMTEKQCQLFDLVVSNHQ